MGECILSLLKWGPEKAERGDHASSPPQPSPKSDTYLVSVPEGNLDGAPRHDEIKAQAGALPRRSAAGTPGFWLVQRLAAVRGPVALTIAPWRRRRSAFSFRQPLKQRTADGSYHFRQPRPLPRKQSCTKAYRPADSEALFNLHTPPLASGFRI